jgi:pimeloyl-ACP methyl ester carboxylesterase
MRAREPDHAGYVSRGGVRVHYEVFGDGPDPIVFTPADTIVDARLWKAQVAFLARHHRVVVIDPRGNGRSDRPVGPEHYTDLQAVGDLVAVMDAVGIDRAVLVGLCDSAWYGLLAAARHPARIAGVVAMEPGVSDRTPKHDRGIDTAATWSADIPDPQGWEVYNEGVWRRSLVGSSRRSATTRTAARSTRTSSTGPARRPVR